jgi:GAF domain-containing protein
MRRDADRLAALRQLMILDSAPERDFDRVTELVAASLGVPIAMVNLLDEHRDWFKSCVGFPVHESPAATSFCEAFFASDEDQIVVEDTQAAGRFMAHPLVTGAPFVRFYAAARLVVAGQTVGTLCAYDLQPRQVSAEQVAELRTLAAAVMTLLAARRHQPAPAGTA